VDVATIQAPGTGVGPHGGKRARRAAIIAAVVLAFAAIVAPFALRSLDRHDASASTTPHATDPSVAPRAKHQDTTTDPALGPHGDLPALLPSRSGSMDGTHVRLGDITSGVLRRTSDGGWQVLVRWNGKLQPVPTRGPVQLGGPPAQGSMSWIANHGLLYTRVAAGVGRFHVYAWEPRNATAYTPPTLVATNLGRVCFNRSFTAYGTCSSSR
jgi:hypothetical protein